MASLSVRFDSTPSGHPCGICGKDGRNAGPGLVLSDGARPVCGACGKQHAPALVALLALAEEAARIARIGRHNVFPPYTALLDLARAAETFAAFAPPTSPEG